jgi:hypothetical protein
MTHDRAKDEEEVALSLLDSVGSPAAEVAAEYAELALDELLDNPALEQIPVFGTLLKVKKAADSIRDALFAKKVLRFLHGAADTAEACAKFVLKHSDPKERRRVGETLLLLLDKADDMVKADMIGRLFARFLLEEINESLLMEAARRLSAIEIEDLRRLRVAAKITDLDESEQWRLSTAGLVRAPESGGYGHGGIIWENSSATNLGRLLLDCLEPTTADGER